MKRFAMLPQVICLVVLLTGIFQPPFAQSFLTFDQLVLDIAGGEGKVEEAGDIITSQISNANSGDQDLHHVLVADALTCLNINIGDLLPGEAALRTTMYVVTAMDFLSSTIDNTAFSCSDAIGRVSTEAPVSDGKNGLGITDTPSNEDNSCAGFLGLN